MAGNLTTTASKLSDKPQTNFRCSLSIEWIGESNELNDIVDLKTRLEKKMGFGQTNCLMCHGHITRPYKTNWKNTFQVVLQNGMVVPTEILNEADRMKVK